MSHLHHLYGNCRSYDEFIEDLPPKEARLDYGQYLESQIEKPLLQILELLMASDLQLHSSVTSALLDRPNNVITNKLVSRNSELTDAQLDDWRCTKLYTLVKERISQGLLR